MEGCNLCQRNKNRTEPPARKLMPNAVPEKPWAHIMADFTKLPLAKEFNSILVVCDRLTRIAHFIPTTEDISKRVGSVILGSCVETTWTPREYNIGQGMLESLLLSWNEANCSKSALTKRTQWEFSLDYALPIYKTMYLLIFVCTHTCCISVESSCH